MMKTLTSALTFLLIISNNFFAQGQHFEWAASGDNLITGYSTSCVTIDGKLIAGGNYETPSYSISSATQGFYDGQGKFYKLNNPYQSQMFINCFDADGKISWSLSGSDIAASTSLLGLTSKPNGDVIIAFRGSAPNEYPSSLFDELGLISDSVLKTTNYDNPNSIYGSGGAWSFIFLAEISPSGYVKDYHAIRIKNSDEWNSFKCAPDGSLYFTSADKGQIIEKDGRKIERPFNYVVKINNDYEIEWKSSMQYLANSCCSYHMKPVICDISETGEVYVAGNFHTGLKAAEGKEHFSPTYAGDRENYKPYESYLAQLSPSDGALKWIKYSGGESLIEGIQVTDKSVFIGGRINRQKKLFSLAADTTDKKLAFLMSFSLSGKPEWLQTFNAESVNALTRDWNGNIFASFRSKRNTLVAPLKIGSDTISNTYERVVVASFTEEGDYRWYKRSGAMMSITPNSLLHTDACGNLYFTGEMWYVLKGSLSLFDAALVSGQGYGGAPIAARIRTTIPDDLLHMNLSLSQQFAVGINKKEKRNKTISNRTPNQTQISDSLMQNNPNNSRGRNGQCVPIPYPWSIRIFPNQSKGPVTIEVDLSYNDKSVSMELWDAKGKFIRNVLPASIKQVGKFELKADFSDLASGLYIIVVKGSGSAATEKFVIGK